LISCRDISHSSYTDNEGIQELFRAYKAFGKAIGPDNLAVWFSNQRGLTATTEIPTPQNNP
jgi:hypothetical protein